MFRKEKVIQFLHAGERSGPKQRESKIMLPYWNSYTWYRNKQIAAVKYMFVGLLLCVCVCVYVYVCVCVCVL